MFTSLFPWVLYLAAWVVSLSKVSTGLPMPMTLLHYLVIFNGGIQGLWGATGHLLFSEQTAQKIGWQSNGFQKEIGYTNLSIGITGMAVFFMPAWTPPVALMIMIYYAGCAYNHIKERIVYKNAAPCNSGPMLYSTIATVLTLAFCFVASINLWY